VPMMPLCIRCGKGAMASTTFGRFCTDACEGQWVQDCLAKLSAEDCMDMMTQLQKYTKGRYTGPERRRKPRAKGVGA
jgi:hypothetical protein